MALRLLLLLLLLCRRAAQRLAQAVPADRDFNTAAFTKELVKFADTEVCAAAAGSTSSSTRAVGAGRQCQQQ
jgi:hypothetical protein